MNLRFEPEIVVAAFVAGVRAGRKPNASLDSNPYPVRHSELWFSWRDGFVVGWKIAAKLAAEVQPVQT